MSDRKKLKMVSSATASAPALVAPAAAPDPEVRAVAKRRQFTAAYKLSVRGGGRPLLESWCDWCAAAAGGAVQLPSNDVATRARGRRAGRRWRVDVGGKPQLSTEQKRLLAVQAENARLKRELEQAHTIIEVQKKLCTLLGLPTAASVESTGSES